MKKFDHFLLASYSLTGLQAELDKCLNIISEQNGAIISTQYIAVQDKKLLEPIYSILVIYECAVEKKE